MVDGILISSENYDLENGSTVLTLKSSYLDTLSVGNHTLEFVYSDGSVETLFAVSNAKDKVLASNKNTISNPQTGDNVMFYISMLGLSVIGLAGIGFYVKKKRYN